MPCYSPLKGFKAAAGGITWTPSAGYVDFPIEVPCGQCLGCRLERSRQWAVRIMHECQMHEENAFVTLTYDDAHLPADGSLNKKHFQDFMKRLRARHSGRISYFHCGEYGDTTGRPHYHAILFGIGFPDRVVCSTNGRGDRVYSSKLLSAVWPMGFAAIGNVTFESAAYCARYCLKKVTGDLAADHYRRVHPETGEIYYLQPEYATMSVRPAIGREWILRYGAEVAQRDGVVVAGKVTKPPRYYDKVRGKEAMKAVKRERKEGAWDRAADNTPDRLEIKRTVKEAQVNQRLKRGL